MPYLIENKKDGGYEKNTWYNIKIRAVNSNFYIYVSPEVTGAQDIKYQEVMHVFDPVLVYGTVAFTSNGNKEMFLDNISIVNIPCSEYDTKEINVALTNTCSRYTENYKNVEDKWTMINLPDINNESGKPEWGIVKKFEGREVVLAQTEEIQMSSMAENGNFYILNDDI